MWLITRKHNLRTLQWSSVASESTEGEKSPTQVKCSVRKKSNIEILMSIYGFLGTYWLVLMVPCKKFRTFNFFHCFRLEIHRNLVMTDLVSVFQGAPAFFLRKFLILWHFLNLQTITDDSSVTQIVKYFNSYNLHVYQQANFHLEISSHFGN